MLPADTLEIDLRALDRVIHHTPEDLVTRVQCGIEVEALERALAPSRQRVPIRDILGTNGSAGGRLASGAPALASRRFGGARDWIIGATAVRFDGELVHSGGNVVKNVSGYDLTRVYVGSFGELGLLVEAAFKLDPIPEATLTVSVRLPAVDACSLVQALDLDNLSPSCALLEKETLHLGFEGSREWVATVRDTVGRMTTGAASMHPPVDSTSPSTATPSSSPFLPADSLDWIHGDEYEVRVRLHHDHTDLASLTQDLDEIDRHHLVRQNRDGSAGSNGFDGFDSSDGSHTGSGPAQSLSLLGSGITYRGWRRATRSHEAHIAAYRAALDRYHGWLMVERQPHRFDRAAPRIAVPPETWKLMRATKAQLDPDHTFRAGIPIFDWTRP